MGRSTKGDRVEAKGKKKKNEARIKKEVRSS